MNGNLSGFVYLIASICFIMALRGLSSATTARSGNLFGVAGMGLAIVATLFLPKVHNIWLILIGVGIGGAIGTYIARTIVMTALPQLVAAFHSLVGLGAVCVAMAALWSPQAFGIGVPYHLSFSNLLEMGLGSIIGAITFTGPLIAFGKLQGLLKGKPLIFPFQHYLNAGLGILTLFILLYFTTTESHGAFLLLTGVALLLGFLLILPIGGADMPVVVSMLNSYSGWAAVGIGFTLNNHLLIITGALVGASGAILSYIMCKGMNRSIINVILGGFGSGSSEGINASAEEQKPVKTMGPEDAAFVLKQAQSVIIVPGYGMAVAQAQHILREITTRLKKENIQVRYAIHPVAGRMPGHMNVLLAEANVVYEDVLELEEINQDFRATDVVFVIGANDITNPAAKTDPTSPIYGMPILDVEAARTVLFVKRSMAAGYAGIENELFYRDNVTMLFGDAKKVCEGIVKEMG